MVGDIPILSSIRVQVIDYIDDSLIRMFIPCPIQMERSPSMDSASTVELRAVKDRLLQLESDFNKLEMLLASQTAELVEFDLTRMNFHHFLHAHWFPILQTINHTSTGCGACFPNGGIILDSVVPTTSSTNSYFTPPVTFSPGEARPPAPSPHSSFSGDSLLLSSQDEFLNPFRPPSLRTDPSVDSLDAYYRLYAGETAEDSPEAIPVPPPTVRPSGSTSEGPNGGSDVVSEVGEGGWHFDSDGCLRGGSADWATRSLP